MKKKEEGNKLGTFLRILLGLILLAIVLASIDLKALAQAILRIRIEFLALAVLAYFFLDLILSYRLFRCLNVIGYKISWKDTFWTHLFGMLLSNVTPGRAGYIGLIYLLNKKKKVPVTKSLSCIGTIESIELIVKAIQALFGLAFIIYVTKNETLTQFGLIGIAIILFMSCTFLLLCWKEIRILNKIVENFPFFGKKVMQLIKEFKGASKTLKSKALFIASFSILGWIARGIEWTFIGYACNINLPFYVFFLLHPILTAIRYVPLTPAGIGMFEGITILGFTIFNVPMENALLLSFFDRIDNVIIDLFAIKEMKHL
ncbi:MAG: flippase-like domain-containing protein [Candidatus Parvarchaeota archaeon]|nr:flippase-like domain-containing protein [Candidatus Jingweiarchaeum tengchongense]MCW1305087.1 flippase-like domain-containing protein [Candidatus Jingweiarchaeum tengchongense]MCW1305149.1 flippase-like domain-containing protein [Candidatus Jingweiarchaeum tengchongense]MCW1310743.1 flippase-like domain-containing protein [Candidatus Jingweiarchaeum tengchongense]